MTPPTVLMPGPMPPFIAQSCAERFNLVKLWQADDPAATLRDVGRSARAIVSGGHPPVDATLMQQLPQLEIVASMGVGYDAIDVQTAAERGVVVTNTPDVLTDDVADIALALLLMAARELPQAEQYLRDGRWSSGPYPLAPTRLRGRRLGVLGLGRIGEAVAHRAEAFGMDISYHNRRPKDVPYRYFGSVTELADHVDTLVITTPGGAATQHLVDAHILQRLGRRGIVVNVARGSVIDEDALAEALRSGVILSAGLDVFEREPSVGDGLLELPNAVLLPHVGSATIDTRRDMGQLVVDNLVNWFEAGAPLTPVPETPVPGFQRAAPGLGNSQARASEDSSTEREASSSAPCR